MTGLVELLVNFQGVIGLVMSQLAVQLGHQPASLDITPDGWQKVTSFLVY
jgi:hypothetical protein